MGKRRRRNSRQPAESEQRRDCQRADGLINSQSRRPSKVVKKGRKQYTVIQLENAAKDVSAGLSVKKAASKWSVPRTTLNDVKLGRYKPNDKPGPNPFLTSEEEQLLEEWIIEMSRRGLLVRRDTVLDSIQHILNEDGRPNPFPDNRPGQTWCKLFMNRHPVLSERCAESISRSRGALTEGCVRGWFSDAKEYFQKKKVEYILHDSTKQYNGDETGFQLDPKTGKIIGPKGEVVYTEAGGNREHMSVLVVTRADGKLMTSAIIYPYRKCIPKPILDSMPESGFCLAKSDSGWMTSAVFFEFFANTFIPELAAVCRKEKGLGPDEELILTDDDWIVFWIDGYSSHLTYHTSQLCERNHILLYCFKAHSSHICQPNDVGPFKPLKNEWRKAVSEWRLKNPYATLNKVNFAGVLSAAVRKLDQASIVSGYRSTGLYPFDENAVHYERLTATNQRKYDDRAFSASQPDVSANETTLTVVESLLGDEVISMFRQVQNDAVVDLSLLPNIHVYVLWKHLHQLVLGDSVHLQQLDLQNVLTLVPEAAVAEIQVQSIRATAEGREQSVTATVTESSELCFSADVCLDAESRARPTPTKIKRGIPHWFHGKVSPAFDRHIFWPSPPKKSKEGERKHKAQLFPACASSHEWRKLYELKQSTIKANKKSVEYEGAARNQEEQQRRKTGISKKPTEVKNAKKGGTTRKSTTPKQTKKKVSTVNAAVDEIQQIVVCAEVHRDPVSTINPAVIGLTTSKPEPSEIKKQKRKRRQEKSNDEQVKQKKRKEKNGKSCIYNIG